VLGRLPWSAKVKPRPDETWEEGAHGAAVVYLVVFAGGWEKVGITMGYRWSPLHNWVMAQDWNINHVPNSGFEHLESMKLFLAAVSL